uniref:Pollen-specific C2 domain containing protein n=1 Tax=Solanum tuberosum TaxID=4113 RepID=M1B5F9_SOLTU
MESSPGGGGSATKSLMDNLLGLLRIKIKKGVNLAVRDVRTSDPYCVVKMGKKQKLKTRVIKKDINPEWNEDLTLSVSDPSLPVKLVTFHSSIVSNARYGRIFMRDFLRFYTFEYFYGIRHNSLDYDRNRRDTPSLN